MKVFACCPHRQLLNLTSQTAAQLSADFCSSQKAAQLSADCCPLTFAPRRQLLNCLQTAFTRTWS